MMLLLLFFYRSFSRKYQLLPWSEGRMILFQCQLKFYPVLYLFYFETQLSQQQHQSKQWQRQWLSQMVVVVVCSYCSCQQEMFYRVCCYKSTVFHFGLQHLKINTKKQNEKIIRKIKNTGTDIQVGYMHSLYAQFLTKISQIMLTCLGIYKG